jgi:molybdate transport system ATP-binding protein
MPGLVLRARQAGPISLEAELACAPGELLALVGPSGAGKTTLLRIIAGLARPKSGYVACDGAVWLDTERGIVAPPQARRVGLVFQHYALFPHMTAVQNVASAMQGAPKGETLDRAHDLLARVHLEDMGQRRPAELSGGQQQRVALARALARDPAALLLDEPFSAVDRMTRRKLQRDLADLRRALAIPIVLVTHDLSEAAALADRLTVLQAGRTRQTGTPAEVMAAPADAEIAAILDLPVDEASPR